jgi:oxygen-independent coproporphyrinogen-3 oxidase
MKYRTAHAPLPSWCNPASGRAMTEHGKNTGAPIGIYVHWPFCASKCPYCDFNSHVRARIDETAWEQAYLRALAHYAAMTAGRPVASVFFGGGTPSLMRPQTVEAILKTVHDLWPVDENVEITLEANPTSVESEKFKGFRAAGVNRVSLGVQALNDNDLKFLGRQHNVSEAMQAIDIARKTFDRYSFDLMYARPQQNLKDWGQELENAVQHADGHLSLYQLTIERSTPFYMDHAQGKFSIPGEDLAADFYNLTQDVLEAAGLPAYEVSNHARAGQESRHNLIYWHYGDYIGIGPGAHGRLTLEGRKWATREHSAPEIWLEKVQKDGNGAHPFEDVPPRERFTEALMMGLRLREGVSLQKLGAEAGGPWADRLDENRLAELEKQGWLRRTPDRLVLEREGLLRLNAILPFIVIDK